MPEVEFIDNSEAFLEVLDKQLTLAMEDVGMEAEGDVKQLCPVDTGRLRNSITYALAGRPANISEYRPNSTDKNGRKPRNTKPGKYTGSAPGDENDYAVFIGTNVEYAKFVEEGRNKTPFLRPGITNNMDKYKGIIEEHLSEEIPL